VSPRERGRTGQPGRHGQSPVRGPRAGVREASGREREGGGEGARYRERGGAAAERSAVGTRVERGAHAVREGGTPAG